MMVPVCMWVSPAHAQVIRSYEALDRSAGTRSYATAVLAFDGATGNANFVDADVAVAVGHKGVRHWVRAYPAFRLKRSEGRSVIDTRSIHLRHSLFLNDWSRTFAFVQVQSEESIDLDRRFLVGGGIRVRLLAFDDGEMALGVGAMQDEERRTGRPERSDVRGANFLAVHGAAGAVKLAATTYFQPDLDAWGDHRMLVQGTVIVPMVAHVSLDMSTFWRRDSRPPAGIGRHDAGLKVGVRVDVD